ncbi:hypothetical protein J1N35_023255 [Gossypium stocksii]|uniref:Uncharacterized protein n=1 Tax=Gossypium stocksii TaxID=47602 RepID=A0A9D3VK00_9ROSI|nr:hypothetical protein J1N35_023255 [Gossypium stocksii]
MKNLVTRELVIAVGGECPSFGQKRNSGGFLSPGFMSRFFYDFPSASSCFAVDQSPIEARRILLRVYLICLDRFLSPPLVSTIMGKSIQSGEYVICCWNHCVVVELFGLSGRHLCLWDRFPDDTRKVFASNMHLFCFEIVVLVVVHDSAYGVTQLPLFRLIHLMCRWCCLLQNYFVRSSS